MILAGFYPADYRLTLLSIFLGLNQLNVKSTILSQCLFRLNHWPIMANELYFSPPKGISYHLNRFGGDLKDEALLCQSFHDLLSGIQKKVHDFMRFLSMSLERLNLKTVPFFYYGIKPVSA
jgi:hypothetical protein